MLASQSRSREGTGIPEQENELPDGAGELRAGWRNLLAATIGIGLGIASYTPVSSLFLHALETEFGWSKGAAAGALIALPITALVLPLAGWLIDRFGVRLVSAVSASTSVASYLWLSRMGGGVKEFYAALLVLNVLGCATGPVAYTRLVAAQFRANRGLALAIAQFGIAFIGVVMPWSIGMVIGAHGWRGGYVFFAGVAAAGGLCAQALMQPAGQAGLAEASHGMRVRQGVASAGFWLLGSAVFAVSAAAFGLVAQFQSVLADRQIGLQSATLLLSLLAGSVMVSRLIVGRLLDRFNPARTSAVVMALAAIGAALLLFGPTGLAATALATALIACSIGAELDLMSFFCVRLFGLRHYAAIYGLLSTFFYIGIAAGGIGYGVIRQTSGSYESAVLGSTLLLITAAVLFLLLGRQEVDAAKER